MNSAAPASHTECTRLGQQVRDERRWDAAEGRATQSMCECECEYRWLKEDAVWVRDGWVSMVFSSHPRLGVATRGSGCATLKDVTRQD